MFFYISFLRPPPLTCSVSGSISITPQIANDLRTAPLDGAQDIYYSWSSPQGASSNSVPFLITKPIKLTTWRQSSAYKELSVPLPPGIRDGQGWRLVMTSCAQGRPHIINVNDPDVGKMPLPVISMPISLHSRHSTSLQTGKQEQIERIYTFPLISNEIVYLIVREQTSYDLDKKIWDSGIGLSSWILGLRNIDGNSGHRRHPKLTDMLFARARRNIIELGAGTGIVSLTIAALRSSLELADVGSIFSTDLASAMPLLEHNISANGHLFHCARPRAAVLDWDDEEFPEDISSLNAGIDGIVMADVTYNTASFPSLVRTLSNLIQFNIQKNIDPPVILLGYKERDSEERTLWEMTRGIGVVFERVGERAGSGGKEVEVWVGTVEVRAS